MCKINDFQWRKHEKIAKNTFWIFEPIWTHLVHFGAKTFFFKSENATFIDLLKANLMKKIMKMYFSWNMTSLEWKISTTRDIRVHSRDIRVHFSYVWDVGIHLGISSYIQGKIGYISELLGYILGKSGYILGMYLVVDWTNRLRWAEQNARVANVHPA